MSAGIFIHINRKKKLCQQLENKSINNMNKTFPLNPVMEFFLKKRKNMKLSLRKNVMKHSCCVFWVGYEIKHPFSKKSLQTTSVSLYLFSSCFSFTLSSSATFLFPRENESSRNEAVCSNIDEKNCEANGDLKRKQSEVVSEGQHPTKFSKSGRDNQQSSFSNGKGPFKKPKGEKKLDWNVLRPSKAPNKSG